MRRCTEALRDLVLAYRGRIEDQLRGSGVTLPQLRMLGAVQQQRELSAAAIARMCNVTPQTLQTMLARAVREGWIVRGTSDHNLRFVTAKLTPQGEQIMRHGKKVAERIEAEVWHAVPLKTLRALRGTLEAGLSNLSR